MQINFIDSAELAELLSDADQLDVLDNGPQRIHVLTYTGADIIAIVDPITGSAAVIYSSEQFDRESGGSIHDHARQALYETGATPG